ncbi:polysulfide reductase [Pelovirga terrestris]|uniref:Polysulfide reductase n=1 Tax=Pelovirga terrestris TaxID=2771352 RepID=A0A8J6QSN0_9BACT|nr:polysulfide reductase [Pelovirga terrestris]MBD1401798.1 polysulfide reductase [Pelovirga terrestris]
MKKLAANGIKPHDAEMKADGRKFSLMEKLLLGLTLDQYVQQVIRNKFNWLLALIFVVGIPLIIYRFIFGLGVVTHSSYDYPWGLFLGFGLFCMVPLSASGFMLGTTVEIFGRHDFEPIERLALLNGLLGYFFAVVYLLVDLGQPWRLAYPMVYSFGPAAVLFLVGWHVATYLSVQVAEVSTAFFEWIGFRRGYEFIRKGTIGLTVSGIILSTLHQGALGALFVYAPGKVHPLWYSASFQWIHFFVSSIPAGLCMVICVSTVVIYTMKWRCDQRFIDSLDRITISLAKGASMGLFTYLFIKLLAVAHDNEWAYLATGWGAWWLFEMFFGVILALIVLGVGIHHKSVALCRLGALITVLGILLNRLNTALIAFNWNLYPEIPHIFEVIISITIFAIYVTTYRFILNRLPILYQFKSRAEA